MGSFKNESFLMRGRIRDRHLRVDEEVGGGEGVVEYGVSATGTVRRNSDWGVWI